MSIVRSANLSSFQINERSRPGSKNVGGYLMYPERMKDDYTIDGEDKKGQDRILFTTHSFKKRNLSILTFNEANPASNTANDPLLNPEIGPPLPERYRQRTELTPETGPPLDVEAFPKTTDFRRGNDFYDVAEISMGGEKYKGVYLPIQDKIQDQNGVDWGQSTLNDIQRRLANFAYKNMEGNGNIEITERIADILKDPLTGPAMRAYLTEQAVGVQNLFARATGNIINPNMELLFNGPTLRPFTFNFKLSPRNSKEAATVKKIIRFFKQAMAPRVNQEYNIFLQSPFVFKIEYLHGPKNLHPSLNLIKHCALQNCSVDYTPNSSYMTYDDADGTMVSYNMNMTFSELTPVFDIDYTDMNPEEPKGVDSRNPLDPRIKNNKIGY